jgi:hypothetical protein
MTLPSILRARALLADREQKEAEHRVWQREHADELSDARLELLKSRLPRRKEFAGADLKYRTTWSEPAPVQTPQTLDDASWNLWARSHCDAVREDCNEVIMGLADEAGSMIGKLERRVNQLSAEVKRLKSDFAKSAKGSKDA